MKSTEEKNNSAMKSTEEKLPGVAVGNKGGNPNWQRGVAGGKVPPHAWKPGQCGNPEPNQSKPFTAALRNMLLTKKVFKRPDGTLLEASELELIARRVAIELRTNPSFDVRLLELILNRLEGKVKEVVEIDPGVEAASAIDARKVILSRLGKLIPTGADTEDGGKPESSRGLSDTVPLGTVGKN